MRCFAQLFATSLVTLVTIGLANADAADLTGRKPNVVFIITDDK